MQTAFQSPAKHTQLSTPVVGDALGEEALTLAWKGISSEVRNSIVRDPLDHLAYWRKQNPHLKQLAYALRKGKYHPSQPVLISLAKRDGSSRELTFCDLEDSIVLRALTDALTPLLIDGFPKCVKYSWNHRPAFVLEGKPRAVYQAILEDDEDFGYDSWLRAWREHTSKLRKMARYLGCEYIALIDIASFFPSINHSLLHRRMSHCAVQQQKLIDLLFFVLEVLLPRSGYKRATQGLPIIDDLDSSRVLAHAFLEALDREFEQEISEVRYARWMDDVAIAVQSEEEGEESLRRAKRSLAGLDLQANMNKTKVLKINHFHETLWTEQNQYLDHADAFMDSGIEICLDEFDGRLHKFLELEHNGIENWDRCLRRFYSRSKRAGSSLLMGHWSAHLRDYPSSADAIIRYLWASCHDRELAEEVFSYVRSSANSYQDVEIRVAEFLLHFRLQSPSENLEWFTDQLVDWFFGRRGFSDSSPLSEYARGLLTLANSYKFTEPQRDLEWFTDQLVERRCRSEVDKIANFALRDKVHSPEFFQYCLYVLTGTDQHRERAMAVGSKLEHKSIRRISTFLMDLERSPGEFIIAAKELVKLKKRQRPFYRWIDARALPLVRILGQKKESTAQWRKHLQTTAATLRLQEGNFLDLISIEFIEREINRP